MRIYLLLSYIITCTLIVIAVSIGCKSNEQVLDDELKETPLIDNVHTMEHVENVGSQETYEIPSDKEDSSGEATDYSGDEETVIKTKEGSVKVVSEMEIATAPTAATTEMRVIKKAEILREEPVSKIKARPGLITAAEWNDIHNWNDWKELMNNQDYNDMQSHWNLYPRSRYSIFVKNKYELPLQDVPVELLDRSGNVLWSARTDNAGRAELWSDMTESDRSFDAVNARIIVGSNIHAIENLKTIEEGVNHLDVDQECKNSPFVDVFFAVDATGSMSDEIEYLQMELQDVISRSLQSNTKLKLRLGSVFYRDSSDIYLTKVQPLTEDPNLTLDFIREQKAEGGGDYPEAVDAAFDEVLAQDWSENAIARIVFFLLDAPPHHNFTVLKRLQQQIADAAKEGIKIIPITASGINRQTEFLMKFMSIATNGTYVFITDHSGIGNPHLDPVVQDYEVEKLNDLLVRLLYNYSKSNGCNANEPLSDGITFFPNPARNYVNITTDKPIRTLKVLGNSGKLMYTKTDIQQGETKIDLAGLVDGVYTIQCSGDELDHSQSIVVVNR